jgi:hypothetical protein
VLFSGSRTEFNPRYTFADYIVGGSNRFAHAAARAVAERPAQTYNPLLFMEESASARRISCMLSGMAPSMIFRISGLYTPPPNDSPTN